MQTSPNLFSHDGKSYQFIDVSYDSQPVGTASCCESCAFKYRHYGMLCNSDETPCSTTTRNDGGDGYWTELDPLRAAVMKVRGK